MLLITVDNPIDRRIESPAAPLPNDLLALHGTISTDLFYLLIKKTIARSILLARLRNAKIGQHRLHRIGLLDSIVIEMRSNFDDRNER